MLDWLAAEPGRPWFLFWHTFEAHSPYTQGRFLPDSFGGLGRDLARLTRMISRADTSATHEGASQVMEELLGRHGAYTAEVCSDLYDGGIASADYWVGRVVAFLLERGLYDATLIVLTSDHGEEFADRHPDAFYDGHGHSAYEEVLRVPLVVKLPGSRHSGARVSAVTSGIDVMPTILEVAGVEGPREQMQGRSLVALWGGGAVAEVPAFSEAAAFEEEIKSLRGPRYKLMLEMGPETVLERGRAFVPPVPRHRRLFDLRADPGERRDLLAGEGVDGAIGDVAARLEQQLRDLVPVSPGEVEEIELDDEAVERLKAMGYVR
jgi:arylsulfatase A-like enzyme